MNILFHVITLGIFWMPSLDHMHKYARTPQKIEYYLSHFKYQEDKVMKDDWKSPEEFIIDGGGDCEDYAIMAYELLKRIGYKPSIYCVWPSNDAEPGHAICVFEKGLFSNHVLLNKPSDNLTNYMKANNYTECERYEWETRRKYVRK